MARLLSAQKKVLGPEEVKSFDTRIKQLGRSAAKLDRTSWRAKLKKGMSHACMWRRRKR